MRFAMAVLDADFSRKGPSAEQLASLAAPLKSPIPGTNPALPRPQRAPWVAFSYDQQRPPEQAYAWGDVAPMDRDREAGFHPSTYANQAVPKITNLQLDHEAATTGDLILATASYQCTAGGFFGDGCDLAIRWLIQASDGSVVLDVRRPASAFQSIPVNSTQGDQQSFAMPNKDVTVTLQLLQARSDLTNLFGQIGAGQQVADQRTIAVQWTPPGQVAQQQAKRSSEDFNASLQQVLAAVGPWLPVVVLGGLVLGGFLLVEPSVSHLVHGGKA